MFQEAAPPTFRVEVVVVGGNEGAEVERAQARAISDMLIWARQNRMTVTRDLGGAA